jgi:hypothetical protein
MAEFLLPIKGVSYGFPIDKSPPATSNYMNNIRAIDVLEKRVRIGQRPGQDKAYSQQVGGAASPVVAIIQITTVD